MSMAQWLSHYTPKAVELAKGDFYIAKNGDDQNDGSLERPFASFERAKLAVRERRERGLGATVCVKAGEYAVGGLSFARGDGGEEGARVTYRTYGDGEVLLSGGLTLDAKSFQPIDEAVRARLRGEAKDKVVCADLSALGLTPADWGPVYAIGAFHTANMYDGDTVGANCELFCDDKRMTLSRYPNGDEYLRVAAVPDVGDVHEFPEQNYYWDWDNRRNHWGGAYVMDKQTTARLKGWGSYKDVWTFGYFYHDWADASTPVAGFNLEHRKLFPKYSARFGCKAGALYYFYNVLDELDEPGEWYLDRESGMLYFYPPVALENAHIEITLSRKPVIASEGANYLRFEGLTVKSTRADGISLRGDHNEVVRCTVKNVLDNAVRVNGFRNLVSECDLSHTGRGGVVIEGGDRHSLTPGESVADNNVIHDWSEVYKTYSPAVKLDGVGNVCSHNEIFNSPQAAILYYGNDHVIEYNYLHEVVEHSSDAGAIYSGQDWAAQGCVVRYNVLENIGAGEFRPDGIYFDDMLSGQIAYGNLIINAKKNGFLIGGGRDNKVYNNVVVRAGVGIRYDDRGYDGFFHNGWTVQSVNNRETSSMWVRLRQSPYRSPVWAAKYPSLARISDDFSNPTDPNFAVNPAFNEVQRNIVIDENRCVGEIDQSVRDYSDVRENKAYASEEEAGFGEGYSLRSDAQALRDIPDFEPLPLTEIGRY